MKRDRTAEARSWLRQSLAELEDARELEMQRCLSEALAIWQRKIGGARTEPIHH